MYNEAALRAFLDKHKTQNKPLSGDDGILWYEFPKDTTKVNIQFLPPVHGNPIPGIYYYQHWLNFSQERVINCFKNHDLDCPMCNLIEPYLGKLPLDKWGNPKYISKVQSKVNVLVLEDPSYFKRYKKELNPKAPHVLSTPNDFILNWLVKCMLEKDPNTGGDFTNPDQAFGWVFYRKKDEGPFEKNLSVIPRKVGSNEEEKLAILAKAADLKKLIKQPDDAYLQRVKDSVGMIKEAIDNHLLVMKNLGNPLAPPPIHNYHAPVIQPHYPVPPVSPVLPPVSAVLPSKPATIPGEVLNGVNHAISHGVAPSPIPTKAKPPGSPVCLGDKEVYSHDKETCRECVWEVHCQTLLGVQV